MFLDMPRGFRDPARILERGDMLRTAEDTLSLEAWARDVEDRRRGQQPEIVLPHFDPAETGIRSQVLLLLEAPGPKTVPEWGGSGFISVDNNDPTAQNVWRTRDEVGLHRGVLAWNIVPWVLGSASVKPTSVDLAQGAVELRGLLALLPDLRCAILSGQKAQAVPERMTVRISAVVTSSPISSERNSGYRHLRRHRAVDASRRPRQDERQAPRSVYE